MSDITQAIHETVDAAKELRAQEHALRDAVASGDEAAILAAARNYFRGEHVEQCDRATARVQRRPGRA